MSRKEGWSLLGICSIVFVGLWIYAGNGFFEAFVYGPLMIGAALLGMFLRRR